MGLPCLNCGKDVPQDEGKLFAECFLCRDCYTIAERVYLQAHSELQMLLVTLKELIRLAIVRHQLSFVPATEDAGDGQLHQKRSIDLIMEMMKNRENPKCTPQPRSTRSSEKPTTTSSAVTQDVDGRQLSSSSPELNSSQETPSTEHPETQGSDSA
jgi:hypothetical protein